MGAATITTSPAGTGTYDAQDRLVSLGGTTFAYRDDGALATKTDGAGTTTYTYDASGQLLSVELPTPLAPIAYTLDGGKTSPCPVVNARGRAC